MARVREASVGAVSERCGAAGPREGGLTRRCGARSSPDPGAAGGDGRGTLGHRLKARMRRLNARGGADSEDERDDSVSTSSPVSPESDLLRGAQSAECNSPVRRSPLEMPSSPEEQGEEPRQGAAGHRGEERGVPLWVTEGCISSKSFRLRSLIEEDELTRAGIRASASAADGKSEQEAAGRRQEQNTDGGAEDAQARAAKEDGGWSFASEFNPGGGTPQPTPSTESGRPRQWLWEAADPLVMARSWKGEQRTGSEEGRRAAGSEEARSSTEKLREMVQQSLAKTVFPQDEAGPGEGGSGAARGRERRGVLQEAGAAAFQRSSSEGDVLSRVPAGGAGKRSSEQGGGGVASSLGEAAGNETQGSAIYDTRGRRRWRQRQRSGADEAMFRTKLSSDEVEQALVAPAGSRGHRHWRRGEGGSLRRVSSVESMSASSFRSLASGSGSRARGRQPAGAAGTGSVSPLTHLTFRRAVSEAGSPVAASPLSSPFGALHSLLRRHPSFNSAGSDGNPSPEASAESPGPHSPGWWSPTRGRTMRKVGETMEMVSERLKGFTRRSSANTDDQVAAVREDAEEFTRRRSRSSRRDERVRSLTADAFRVRRISSAESPTLVDYPRDARRGQRRLSPTRSLTRGIESPRMHAVTSIAEKFQRFFQPVLSRTSSTLEGQAYHPVDSLDQLYAQAAGIYPHLKEKAKTWALDHHGMFKVDENQGAGGGGTYEEWQALVERMGEEEADKNVKWAALKDPERAIEKLVRSYDGKVSKILDICRQSIVFETLEGLARCFATIASDDDVVILSVKNRLRRNYDAKAQSLGYRDVNINLRFNSEECNRLGIHLHVCELQLILRAFSEYKSEAGHKRYVAWRNARGK